MNRLFAVTFFLAFSFVVTAQNDLMDLLNQDTKPEITYATATFKSTRILNGHSIERMQAGQLDFRIAHRFGLLNSGPYEFFGLDQSNIHISLEYGIFNWLMVGAGRGNYEKTFDGFTKLSILRQSSGARFMPVSISLFSSVALKSVKWADPERTNYFSSRLSYTAQVLIASKISQGLSIQISPSYVHRNLVATEYYYVLNANNTYMSQPVYNPLSIGVDIETGGHVFQLLFTNSLSMIEKGFIGETTGRWLKGDIHFGFNISRVFTLNK